MCFVLCVYRVPDRSCFGSHRNTGFLSPLASVSHSYSLKPVISVGQDLIAVEYFSLSLSFALSIPCLCHTHTHTHTPDDTQVGIPPVVRLGRIFHLGILFVLFSRVSFCPLFLFISILIVYWGNGILALLTFEINSIEIQVKSRPTANDWSIRR